MMKFDEPTLTLLGECYLLLEEYNLAEKITDLRRFAQVWHRLREVGALDRAEEIRLAARDRPRPGYLCQRCGRTTPADSEAHKRVSGVPMLACPHDGTLLLSPTLVSDYVLDEAEG